MKMLMILQTIENDHNLAITVDEVIRTGKHKMKDIRQIPMNIITEAEKKLKQ